MPAALVYASRKAGTPNGLRMKHMMMVEASRCESKQRVGYPMASGVHWVPLHKSSGDHHLRTVLPSQIVYDLGDDGDWRRCRLETEALWATLEIMGIPHWRCLSGGRGTHTELFLRDWHADRMAIHKRLRTLVYEVSGVWLRNDERFVAAPDGNVLLREFGHSKQPGGNPKTLYPFAELPDTREQAYRKVKTVLYPSSIPLFDSPWDLPVKVLVPNSLEHPELQGIGRNGAKLLFDQLRETGELPHIERFKLLMYLLRQGRTDADIHAVFCMAKNYAANKTQYAVDHARRTYGPFTVLRDN